MLQGIGERTAKKCNVSLDVIFVSAQAEGSVGLHVDLAPLDSCTFVSLVTELSRTLDDSSNAPALAQGASQNRAPFDMVAER